MKKVLFIIMLIACINLKAQTKVENEILSMKIENGEGIDIPVRFSINIATQEKLKTMDKYKMDMVKSLETDIAIMAFQVKSKCKNKTSFDFTPNCKGAIVIDNAGKIMISFPFKSQNSYGNDVKTQAIKVGTDEPMIIDNL